MSDDTIYIYTDGSCPGNPGPGGYAAIIQYPDGERKGTRGYSTTDITNQQAELLAALLALSKLAANSNVVLISDSAYLVNCMTQRWWEKWQRNGWRNSEKKSVKNQRIWLALIEEAQRHNIQWQHVRGHSGVELNEMADRLAGMATQEAIAIRELISEGGE